jgi:hypothetical protein
MLLTNFLESIGNKLNDIINLLPKYSQELTRINNSVNNFNISELTLFIKIEQEIIDLNMEIDRLIIHTEPTLKIVNELCFNVEENYETIQKLYLNFMENKNPMERIDRILFLMVEIGKKISTLEKNLNKNDKSYNLIKTTSGSGLICVQELSSMCTSILVFTYMYNYHDKSNSIEEKNKIKNKIIELVEKLNEMVRMIKNNLTDEETIFLTEEETIFVNLLPSFEELTLILKNDKIKECLTKLELITNNKNVIK